MSEQDTIAVWFSCGAASAVAAKKTIELYGDRATIRIINNPIVEEDEDNRRFLKDVEDWLGIKIELAVSTKYPSQSCVDVWDKRKFMAGSKGAPCTTELKKKARQQWEQANPHNWLVLGFTFEEQKRAQRFMQTERDNLLPVLIDQKITKADCFKIINNAGIELPWNHVRKMHPDIFSARAKQSRDLGAKLVRVKGKRLFLDELDKDAKGQSLKFSGIECGIFCEEQGE